MPTNPSSFKRDVAIIGAGGHTRSLLRVIEALGIRPIGIFDENHDPGMDETILGYPLIGKSNQVPENVRLILSIGDNRKRAELFSFFGDRVFRRNLIHSTAKVDPAAILGPSNQLLSDCYIAPEVSVAENNIFNTGSVVEHESTIGSHNHISVGSIVCGRARIGDFCFLGAGAVVIDKISICSGVTVGANSVVVRDIVKPGTYAGNPVRKLS